MEPIFELQGAIMVRNWEFSVEVLIFPLCAGSRSAATTILGSRMSSITSIRSALFCPVLSDRSLFQSQAGSWWIHPPINLTRIVPLLIGQFLNGLSLVIVSPHDVVAASLASCLRFSRDALTTSFAALAPINCYIIPWPSRI